MQMVLQLLGLEIVFSFWQKKIARKITVDKTDLNNCCMEPALLPLSPLHKFGTENLFNYFKKKKVEKSYKRMKIYGLILGLNFYHFTAIPRFFSMS